jgi:hypothetical protein
LPEDVAQAIVDLLNHPARSLPSRIEIRPSRLRSSSECRCQNRGRLGLGSPHHHARVQMAHIARDCLRVS